QSQCAPVLLNVRPRLTTSNRRPPKSLSDATTAVSCLCFVATRRRIMINKAKLFLVAALKVTRFAATPAFGQSFDEDDGTGNALRFSYRQTAPDKAASHHAPVHA